MDTLTLTATEMRELAVGWDALTAAPTAAHDAPDEAASDSDEEEDEEEPKSSDKEPSSSEEISSDEEDNEKEKEIDFDNYWRYIMYLYVFILLSSFARFRTLNFSFKLFMQTFNANFSFQ